MRYLKSFNESTNYEFPTNPDEIIEILDRDFAYKPMKVSKIHSDGTVDVEGDAFFTRRNGGRIPVKFGIVTGNFICNGTSLTTLEGSPHTVGETFYSGGNLFTDLVGGPKSVKSIQMKQSHNLTSLVGLPKRIETNFDFEGCKALWDLRPLGNSILPGAESFNSGWFHNTPGQILVQTFGRGKKFLDSLPFNYIRKPIVGATTPHKVWTFPTLNLFRFMEALEDAEVDLDKFKTFYSERLYNTSSNFEWWYVNDEGERVDFEGNPISK